MSRFWLKNLLVGLFVSGAAIGVFAQSAAFRVGETVEFECSCYGPSEWRTGKIEKITGSGDYEIRYGTGRYSVWQARKDRVRAVGAGAKIVAQQQLHEQFKQDAAEYRMSVLYLMQVHDQNLLVNGSQAYRPPVREDDWAQIRADLPKLDALCKSKYAGIANLSADETNIDEMPATWCAIAARHKEYESKARVLAASDQFTPILRAMLNDIQQSLDEPNQYIDEDIQLLMYERDKWKAVQNAKLQKKFAKLGVTMPTDFFKEVEAKADQLKNQNERLALTRTFLMPKYRDAAVEAFVRSRYAAEKKGVQILKIGLDEAGWVIHRNSLGIPTSQTKVARLLVKVPNRPFCQEHSIAAERKYTGGRLAAMNVDGGVVGGEGLFMRCE